MRNITVRDVSHVTRRQYTGAVVVSFELHRIITTETAKGGGTGTERDFNWRRLGRDRSDVIDYQIVPTRRCGFSATVRNAYGHVTRRVRTRTTHADIATDKNKRFPKRKTYRTQPIVTVTPVEICFMPINARARVFVCVYEMSKRLLLCFSRLGDTAQNSIRKNPMVLLISFRRRRMIKHRESRRLC